MICVTYERQNSLQNINIKINMQLGRSSEGRSYTKQSREREDNTGTRRVLMGGQKMEEL
jgi:hypothetical protein